MNIIRAGIYSAIATGARLLAGLVTVKLVAWFAGPVGVGKMGQFLSIISVMTALAGGGIASGITKYVAEYRDSSSLLRRLINTGLTFSAGTSLLIGVLALIFSRQLAVWLLGDAAYESLIWLLAVTQALVALHNQFIAIINGFMDVRRVARIYVFGAVLGVLLTAVLAWQLHLYGALLALVLGQAALCLISGAALRKSRYFSREYVRVLLDKEMLGKLVRYSTMTLTSVLLPNLVNIWVRNYLAERFSWEQVGYWQAVSKVSEAYLLFITMAIGMYYLPKLSSIKQRDAFRKELRSAYCYIMPMVIFLATMVYLLRDRVILALYTGDFINALPLFAPQLIGDVVKIAAYIFSYIMLAKAMAKAFLFSEVFFSITYVILVRIFVGQFGLVGTMYAFTVNYVGYWCYTCLVARWYVRRMD